MFCFEGCFSFVSFHFLFLSNGCLEAANVWGGGAVG